MAQTGITEPYKGRAGQIHTDNPSVSGNSYRCEVGRCPHPCAHCAAPRCKGWLRWTREDFEQGNTISCSENPDHRYNVIVSG